MKFKSYNQELLISQALIGNIFNNITIDRRNHGTNIDYYEPISLEDIKQKQIQIPCIFGDKSIILKSLQNESGAIKLPLYILTSKSIKVDTKRQADIHFDIFFQQDECFSKLPKDHPAYRPYSLKKRRGLPITVDYDLTIITKYKEDLDQMLTNWMVNWRPDIYVKWWHPKNKHEPLQSEILWDQSINYDSNTDNDGKTKFQWKANTTFTFKSWLFSGLNYDEDSLENDLKKLGKQYQPIIEKFNIYNANPSYDNVQIDDYGVPVLGELFEKSDTYYDNTISIQAINDVTADFDQIYKFQQTPEYFGDTVDQNYWQDAKFVWDHYVKYLTEPPVNDNVIKFDYVYLGGRQYIRKSLFYTTIWRYSFQYFLYRYYIKIKRQ